MKYKLLLPVLLICSIFISCNNKNRASKNSSETNSEDQNRDEVWKQYLTIKISTMQKMPPDSGCVIILDHKKVSYYKGNKLQFAGDLTEYLKNDSLIVYRVNDQPGIQIGYNRKDSVVLLTTEHPEGGNPTGDMEYFAKKIEADSPFH